MIKTKFWRLFLTLSGLIFSTQANAQTYQPSNRTPVADKTLGTQVSGNGKDFNITGGLNRGQTLLHSFTDFSIPTGGAANFNNPAGIRDIITRVTGRGFSDLNGTLNSNGANFLLINPNGVVFGPNARLNVGKAFAASTASGVDLIDGQGGRYTFGTNANGDAPLLKINPNVFFNVSQLNIGAKVPGKAEIINYGTLQNQTNNSGQYIGLIGGDVKLIGGKIIAPGGKVELAGLSQAGGIGFSFNQGVQFPANVERGDVVLETKGTSPSFIDLQSAGGGSSVDIFAKDITLRGTGTRITTGISAGSSSPNATTGDIKVDATGKIELSEADIFNQVAVGGVGKAGNIEINTRDLSLTNGGTLTSSTFGTGNAGNVKITASGDVFFDGTLNQGNKDTTGTTGTTGAFSTVEKGGEGKGGNVEIINTRNLSLTNGAQLQASTKGKGDAGNVKITASGDISVNGTPNKNGSSSLVSSTVEPNAVGNGGNVEINTRNLSLTNGGQIQANTLGKGDAGNVKITASGDISVDGLGSSAFSTVEQTGEGKGGNVEINNTRNLSLTNGGQLQASTKGKGDAGNVKITASGDVSVDGTPNKNGSSSLVSSTVEPNAVGNGGDVEIINTRNLSLTNGGQLQASTKGKGNAGNVRIKATDNIFFDGFNNNGIRSGASSSVGFSEAKKEGVGKGGNVEINTRNLSLTNGGVLTSSTFGEGNAGNVKIKAIDNISFDGTSGAFTVVVPKAVGNGGNVEIDTRNLSLTNGGALSADTRGKGDAGNVKITASGDISLDGTRNKNGLGSSVFSTIENTGEGKGGNVEINTRNLFLTNGGALTADTKGKGDAGNVKITASGDISFDGTSSGAFSAVEPKAVGKGGNVEIDTRNLSLTNGGVLNSSTLGTGEAGNIVLKANTITLNKGGIGSQSVSSTGGNINISTKDSKDYLLLRNNSLISTNSGSSGKNGNGGNITISSPLIIALPGKNDISANANAGNGGRVDITSKGLFGIKFRPIGSDFTSDITVSSTFGQSGIVNISTPGVDPGKDSTELPKVPTDASNQISQACSASNRQNKFTVAGRGGLPPNASDPLTSDVVWQDARAASSQTAVSTATTDPTKLAPPAVGLVFDGKGKATLIAAGTQGQPTGTNVTCPNVRTRSK
jgi:filamentous hemagglutinin family protein